MLSTGSLRGACNLGNGPEKVEQDGFKDTSKGAPCHSISEQRADYLLILAFRVQAKPLDKMCRGS